MPLLPKASHHLTAHVDTRWADLILLACYTITGLLDSAAITIWGSFVSVVLTSIYCDLFSDQQLLKLHNAERNRRAAAPVSLLAGALCGGGWTHSSVGLAGALWTAALLKALIVLAWLGWREESRQNNSSCADTACGSDGIRQ